MKLKMILVIMILLLLSGCGSMAVSGYVAAPGTILSGVMNDVMAICLYFPNPIIIFYALDIPFSLIVDIFLLIPIW